MATATRPRTARNSKPQDNATAPADSQDNATALTLPTADNTLDVTIGKAPAPADSQDPPQAVPSPNFQDALNGPTPPAPALDKVDIVNPSADPNTLEFVAVNARLGALIRSQHQNFIAWYSRRGNIVLEGLNIKCRKAMSKDARRTNRADAIKAMEATARANFDRDIEPEPKLDRWISHAVLCNAHPNAVNLKSVGAADVVATLFTRVDPPRAWNAPEEYALKTGLDSASVARFIDRAVSESWTKDDCKAALDTLWGSAQEPDKVKDSKDDPIKAARTLAESIMDKIKEHKVDPETLFDELQSQLTRYGWTLVKGHSENGAETLKPLQIGRSQTAPKS